MLKELISSHITIWHHLAQVFTTTAATGLSLKGRSPFKNLDIKEGNKVIMLLRERHRHSSATGFMSVVGKWSHLANVILSIASGGASWCVQGNCLHTAKKEEMHQPPPHQKNETDLHCKNVYANL